MGMIINPYAFGAAYDADAQAFFTAAGITDTTEKSAVNQLVLDLKSYSIWTKMKALYPFVGGTSTTHKYNLKDPQDTDAAFRLVFSGGGTHSSTGWLPNGTNGYADTKLVPNTSLTFNNTHLSLYSRTNVVTNAWNGASNSYLPIFAMMLRSSDNPNLVYFDGYDYSAHRISATNTDSRGLFIGSITSSTSQKIIKNGSVLVTNTTAQTQNALPSYSMYLGNRNDAGTITGTYDNKELALASIGDGLTDTEAANFYTAVQTFQTTLGRQVGVPIVSDADAQAFLNAAVITDTTQASAVNQLVTDLKGYGIWTKMSAIYPFVGGTSTTHKYNLKNPLDTDAAFRLVFYGGVTHDLNGITGNQTNGYADTFVNDQIDLSIDDKHISMYQRNILPDPSQASMGISSANRFYLNYSGNNYSTLGMNQSAFAVQTPQNGMFIMSKIISGEFKYYQNALTAVTKTGTNNAQNTKHFILGCNNGAGTLTEPSSANIAFASLGNGLSASEVTDLRTAVVAFQTTLGRNV